MSWLTDDDMRIEAQLDRARARVDALERELTIAKRFHAEEAALLRFMRNAAAAERDDALNELARERKNVADIAAEALSLGTDAKGMALDRHDLELIFGFRPGEAP